MDYDCKYFTDNVYKESFWDNEPFWDTRFDLLHNEFDFSSMLDIGCGLGSLVASALRAGIDARGLDASEYAVEHSRAPEKVDLVNLDLGKLPYCDGQFELVVALDVLEHVDPTQIEYIVSELCRTARTYVVVKVPMTKVIHHHQVEMYKDHFAVLPGLRQLALLTELRLWVKDHELDAPPEHVCVLSPETWCLLFSGSDTRRIFCSDAFHSFDHYSIKDTLCFVKV